MNAPNVPRNVKATPGSKTITVTWAAPATDSSHGKAQNYVINVFNNLTSVRVYQKSTTDLKFVIDKLSNGVPYKVELWALNTGGTSAKVTKFATPAAPSAAMVTITMTKIGPDKIANTRPGQSLADAPTLSVTGTNLDQAWGIDALHKLEWKLYTDTTYATVFGTDSVSVMTTNDSSTGFTISSPVAPGGAHVDSNSLIGPWRLVATYVPDPAHPATTTTAHSPGFYTTAVGTVVVGTASPNPLHDADTVTLTGPDIGICSKAVVTIGGISLNATLTRVDQNTATFICPTFGLQLNASGDIVVEYTLNGNVLASSPFAVNYDASSGGTGVGGGGSGYVPPPAADVPDGDMGYPLTVLQWVFSDPAGIEADYPLPRNPDAMTSPFRTRNITAKYTTAIDGKVLLTEGAPQLANWQFSGTIKNALHYELLRHWVQDRNARTLITDHYGRVIECVLLNFNAVPRTDIQRYWSHTYTVTAIVIDVGPPTLVPA